MNSRSLPLFGVLASFCYALPSLFSRESIHLQIANAFEAQSDWGPSMLFDQAMAFAWSRGGIVSAELLFFFISVLPWIILFAFLTLATRLMPAPRATRLRTIALLGAALLGSYGLWQSYHAYRTDVRPPLLTGPLLLLEESTTTNGRIYLDQRALAFAQMFDHHHAGGFSTPEEYLDVLESPLAWRIEDRKAPFSAVVLTYPFANSRRLFDFLSASPEWALGSIDNKGVLFRRTFTELKRPTLKIARQLFYSPREQSIWLGQAALVLEAAGQHTQAAALMDEALALTPQDPRILANAASLSAAHGKWHRAKSEAKMATSFDPKSISAHYLLALACMKTGALDAALNESAKLVQLAPGDASTQLLRARIAEAANDPATEAASLERLLEIARSQNQPTDGILLLLGQAWARAGFPSQALKNKRAALSGDLSSEQRKLVEESIELIESRIFP
jgi:tetratricopeptide (TPR) repeat protein